MLGLSHLPDTDTRWGWFHDVADESRSKALLKAFLPTRFAAAWNTSPALCTGATVLKTHGFGSNSAERKWLRIEVGESSV